MFIRITIMALFATCITGCYLSHEREEAPEPIAPLCGRDYDPMACGPHPDGPDNYFDYWHETDGPADDEVVYKVRVTASQDGMVAYGGRIRALLGRDGNTHVALGDVSDVLEHTCVLEWLECRRSAEWEEGIPEQEIPILFAFQVTDGDSFGFTLEGDIAERVTDGFVGHSAAVGSSSGADCPDSSLMNVIVQRCDPIARCLPVETRLVSSTLMIDGVPRDTCFVHVLSTPNF